MSEKENNPYTAPNEELLPESQLEHHFTGELKKRGFSEGGKWISSAFYLLKQAPFLWIVGSLLFFILTAVISFIPFGTVLTTLMSAIFAGGVCWTAHQQYHQNNTGFNDLVYGFHHKLKPLAILGAIMLGVNLLAMLTGALAIGLVAGLELAMEYLSMLQGGGGGDAQHLELGDDPGRYLIGMMLGLLIFFLITFTAVMFYWFAPALITLDDLPVIEAMKLSFKACLKNMLPFMLYGLLFIILLVVAIVPLGLGLLVVLPMLMISMYTTYYSVFR